MRQLRGCGNYANYFLDFQGNQEYQANTSSLFLFSAWQLRFTRLAPCLAQSIATTGTLGGDQFGKHRESKKWTRQGRKIGKESTEGKYVRKVGKKKKKKEGQILKEILEQEGKIRKQEGKLRKNKTMGDFLQKLEVEFV